MEQHVPLTDVVPQKPKLPPPPPLPSQANTIPHVCYVTQISTRPRRYWVHTDESTSCPDLLVCEGGPAAERKTFLLDGGLPHGPGMSGGIWKINLTIASCVWGGGGKRKTCWHEMETFLCSALVHVTPLFGKFWNRDCDARKWFFLIAGSSQQSEGSRIRRRVRRDAFPATALLSLEHSRANIAGSA